ncbi:unnamed protein product [Dicrocoelium dendriticum]|nr:unnamed protein product [Dicrocoelium dendriticum]
MKQPVSDEPSMTKSLRDIFSDSEEEFAQLVSPKATELRRLEKLRYVTHAERKVLSPYNPPSECHSPSSTKKAEAAAAKQRQSGFCQTSPELLMLAKAEALGRRAAELANRHVYSKYS